MTLSLIGRVEKLDGPSREVDARIHYALFPDTEILLDAKTGRRGPLSEMPIEGWADWEAICRHIDAKPVTASLDAVVALVERVRPGSEWAIDRKDELDGTPWFSAVIGESLAESRANPAIALLLALLRSLSSGGENE